VNIRSSLVDHHQLPVWSSAGGVLIDSRALLLAIIKPHCYTIVSAVRNVRSIYIGLRAPSTLVTASLRDNTVIIAPATDRPFHLGVLEMGELSSSNSS